MPIHPLRRIEDKLRDKIVQLDYLLYLVLNPFKFKKFPQKVNRILIIEMLQLGDFVVATPTFKALREKYKNAKIDILIKPETKLLAEGNKNIDEIMIYKSWKETVQKIKEKKYDLGVILHPGSFKISSLLLLGGVKYRVGATKVGMFSGKGFFLNKKVKPNLKWQHKMEDNLDVLRAMNIHPKEKPKLEIALDAKAEKIVKKFLNHWKGKKIIMHTASKSPSNRWIPERFARLADILITKYKATILFTGAKEDHHDIEYIMNNIRQREKTHNLAGRTTLQQLVALADQVDLIITVDTSMTHIASTTKTPIVVLFGRDIPTCWGPTSKKSTYIWKEKEACVGCRRTYCVYKKNYECMRSIYESDVVAKVAEVFP
ncbi:glycosyltransferase family 9 protein [Candidatus Woesearchaeota archaeon]|nr:glycosyltransferase family 9 protein [Candidatus Woesearchaeota archaeon]